MLQSLAPSAGTILPEAGEQNPLLRMTAFYALESNHQTVLWDVRPDVVIMYDPDMACIRQLEVSGRVVGGWQLAAFQGDAAGKLIWCIWRGAG